MHSFTKLSFGGNICCHAAVSLLSVLSTHLLTSLQEESQNTLDTWAGRDRTEPEREKLGGVVALPLQSALSHMVEFDSWDDGVSEGEALMWPCFPMWYVMVNLLFGAMCRDM